MSLGINRQVTKEYLAGNRGVFILMTCVVALTFVVYGLYGGLTRTYTVEEGARAAEPLVLPADIVIYEPDWTTLTVQPLPGLETMGTDSQPGYRAREQRYLGQAVNVETRTGYHMLWGIEAPPVGRQQGFSVVAGRWPAAGSELLVPEELGMSQGSPAVVQYLNPFTQETTRVTASVVGIYEAAWTIEHPWISSPVLTQELLGSDRANLLLVYKPSTGFRRVSVDTLLDRYGSDVASRTLRVPSFPVDARGVEPPRWLRTLGGKASFDIGLVGPQMFTESSVAAAEAEVRGHTGFALIPIMLTVLSVVVAILTLIVVNVFIGQQRTIGVWRALGVSAAEIGRLYFFTTGAVGVAGSLLGLAVYVPLLTLLNRFLEQPLPIPWSSIPLWLLIIIFLGAWARHVAKSLYTASSIRSLLLNETLIDWWALVRIELGATKPGELEAQ